MKKEKDYLYRDEIEGTACLKGCFVTLMNSMKRIRNSKVMAL
jgi:hypothetical protein